jgi:oxidoreductase
MNQFNESSANEPFVAVVAGATGATGRWIVGDLVNDPNCSKVIALTRSDIDPAVTFPSADKEQIQYKLIVHKMDWEALKEKKTLPSLGATPTVGFCAMGSAPYTEESDYTLPVAFGEACKKGGVKSMFMLSAGGVKNGTGSWFGYIDTLGRREAAYIGFSFERLGIYRPGMMDRQEKRRSKEILGRIMPSCWVIDTRDISRTMVASVGRMKPGYQEFTHSDMKKFAAGKV